MSIWAILLRVLLSALLMFNGTAAAMASVHMAHGPAPRAAAAEASAVDMPCHQHSPSAATASVDSPMATPVPPPESEHLLPDCCKSSACRCACMHSTPAAVSMMAFTAATVEHVRSMRPMSLGHADPALPHLNRPPIG